MARAGWRSRAARAVVALVVASGALATAGPPPVSAAPDPPSPGTVWDLQLDHTRDLAVDPGSGAVVVAGEDGVEVVAADGTDRGVVAGIDRAREVIVHDGSAYVLDKFGGVVHRVDVATATLTATWDLAPRDWLQGLAVSGGRLWTTTAVPHANHAVLVSIDLATGAVETAWEHWEEHPAETVFGMVLAVSPTEPGIMVGVEVTAAYTKVNLFDTSGDEVRRIAVRRVDQEEHSPAGLFAPQDVAFSHDGATIEILDHARDAAVQLRRSDLAHTGVTYPVSSPFAESLSLSPTEDVIATGSSSDREGYPDLVLHRVGDPDPIATYDVNVPGAWRLVRLDHSPDGRRLHVLLAGPNGQGARIVTLDLGPQQPAPRLWNPRGLAVDPGTGRVFVGGDTAVAVHDAAGHLLRQIPALDGANSLLPAAGAIWALLRDSSTIARIDPETMAVTARWRVGRMRQLEGLAYAAGRIWTTGWDDVEPTNSWASLDPATGTVRLHTGDGKGWLLSSPTDPTLLVVVSSANLQSHAIVHRIRGGEPTRIAWWQDRETSGPFRGASISPDGTRLRLACGSCGTYLVEELSMPTLTEVGTYSTARDAEAVASTGGQGGYVAMGTDGDTPQSADLWLHRPGTAGASLAFDLSNGNRYLVHDGLRFAPDGSRLYALRRRGTDVFHGSGPYDLVVLDVVARTSSVYPQVVGTRGGGRTEVRGTRLSPAGARLLSWTTDVPVPATGGGDRVTLTLPALPSLPTDVVTHLPLLRSTGGQAPAGPPLLVADLGPFRTSPSFTDRQHRDLLGRPSTVAEQRAEDARLAGNGRVGALPAWLLVSSLGRTPRPDLIRLYQATFLRAPDTAGLAHWSDQVRRGRSLSSVAAAFTASAEFRARYANLDDDGFVTVIYENVVRRGPDAEGKAYWLGRLRAGLGRGRMVELMAQSAENRARTAPEVEITISHLDMLRRAPSRQELENALAGRRFYDLTLVDEVEAILRSEEYRRRIG